MHKHKLPIPVDAEIREKSFIAIQVRGGAEEELRAASPLRFDFTPMKLFHRLRKFLTRLIFAFPSSSRRESRLMAAPGDGTSSTDPPKTSCSSYYTSNKHYSEAIADCIEFFNKSSEGKILLDLDDQKTSDAHVMTIV